MKLFKFDIFDNFILSENNKDKEFEFLKLRQEHLMSESELKK